MRKGLRVLWIQWRDIKHPWSGGAEVYMHEICKRLTRMGIMVHAVTSWFPGLKIYEELDGYSIERIGSHDNFILYVPKVLKRYSDSFDVIVEDMSKSPLLTPILRLNKRIPVVGIVHHLNREIYFRELPPLRALIAFMLESFMPILYTHLPGTILVTVSKSTKEELIRLGADKNKIVIIPNAINSGEVNDINDIDKYPEPTVIYFTRIKGYKQPHHVLLAFKRLLRLVPNARLILAGKGSEILSGYVERMGLREFTEIYGEIDEKTKIKLLCKSWVLVQTSRKEGFGITVLEAAACKTPTVAYNVPGLRDSVKHMETGILVEPGSIKELSEAIIRLLRDESLRKRLSEKAFNYSKTFSWESSARTFYEVLKDMLGNGT